MLEFNNDQRREWVNTGQRFQAWRVARQRLTSFRGSMVWSTSRGREYLLRSTYTVSGKRVQRSLGPRSDVTEGQKAQFDLGREEAMQRAKAIKAVLARQAAVNRALRLGRVPLVSAQILRALDAAGILGNGIRVVGTQALYAYEASAGVMLDSGITTTEDIDLLRDARVSLRFSLTEKMEERSILGLLKSVDKSFQRSKQMFRAINEDGFFVDLIKPVPNPPWKSLPAQEMTGDMEAVGIEGLQWLENAPSFEAVVIDTSGAPCRMQTIDPRVFAAHKLWVSQQPGREAIKRRRDRAQAFAVAALSLKYFEHLPFEPEELRMLPAPVFEQARHLFSAKAETDDWLS